MILPTPKTTRTDTLFPDTTLFRSLLSRLEAEYKVDAGLEMAPFETARWISGDDVAMKAFTDINRSNLAKDRDGNPVYLAKSAWDVGYVQDRNPDVRFSRSEEHTSELQSLMRISYAVFCL